MIMNEIVLFERSSPLPLILRRCQNTLVDRQSLSRNGDQLKAEFGRFALEFFQLALTIFELVIVGTQINVLFFIFQHIVNNSCQLMSRRRNGFGGAELGAHTTIKGAERTVAKMQTLRRHP